MSVLTDPLTRPPAAPARPPARPASPVVPDDGTVTVLHRRRVIATGGLAARSEARSSHLVVARAVPGVCPPAPMCWWIAAAAVWTDGDGDRPRCPRPIGLATATTVATAALSGLSDRLGWEAVHVLEHGGELPVLTEPVERGGVRLGRDVVVHDGRIGHDVPTLVVTGPGVVRWGSGATWSAALRRALFGDAPGADVGEELEAVAVRLRAADVVPALVDVGTDVLRRAGIVRCSVQLTLVP